MDKFDALDADGNEKLSPMSSCPSNAVAGAALGHRW